MIDAYFFALFPKDPNNCLRAVFKSSQYDISIFKKIKSKSTTTIHTPKTVNSEITILRLF